MAAAIAEAMASFSPLENPSEEREVLLRFPSAFLAAASIARMFKSICAIFLSYVLGYCNSL